MPVSWLRAAVCWHLTAGLRRRPELQPQSRCTPQTVRHQMAPPPALPPEIGAPLGQHCRCVNGGIGCRQYSPPPPPQGHAMGLPSAFSTSQRYAPPSNVSALLPVLRGQRSPEIRCRPRLLQCGAPSCWHSTIATCRSVAAGTFASPPPPAPSNPIRGVGGDTPRATPKNDERST